MAPALCRACRCCKNPRNGATPCKRKRGIERAENKIQWSTSSHETKHRQTYGSQTKHESGTFRIFWRLKNASSNLNCHFETRLGSKQKVCRKTDSPVLVDIAPLVEHNQKIQFVLTVQRRRSDRVQPGANGWQHAQEIFKRRQRGRTTLAQDIRVSEQVSKMW